MSSCFTETAHAHYVLREKTKETDINMDGGSRKPNWSEAEISLLVEQGRAEGEIFTFPFGNK